MADPIDVKPDPVPSAGDKGVINPAPPPGPDVKPDPSSVDPQVAPDLKPHEESIPYERFKEEIDKRKELEGQLTEIQAKLDQPAIDPDANPWGFDLNPTQPASDPAFPSQDPKPPDPAITNEDIEQQLRDNMYNKPLQTLYPLMMQAAKQVNQLDAEAKARVRSIPDFKDYESDYYGVPNDLVNQAQSDPEIVRYLLAKHKATLAGRSLPSPGANPISNPILNPIPTPDNPVAATFPPTNGQPNQAPAQSMDDLKEQFRIEGEQRMLEKIQQQQGSSAEGTQTFASAASDQLELDAEGKSLMAKLGIADADYGKVAGRLNQFMNPKK